MMMHMQFYAREEEREQEEERQEEKQYDQSSFSFSTIAIANHLAREQPQTAVAVIPNIQTSSRILSHNPRVQQISLANRIALSTGNIVQSFILTFINPSRRYQFPFADAQLNPLRNNQGLHRYAHDIIQELQARHDNDGLRHRLRQYYAAAAAAGGQPPDDDDDNNRNWRQAFSDFDHSNRGGNDHSGDDLPLQIAKKIALIYYANLELTVEDVKGVVKEFFSQKEDLQKVDDAFVNKIVHARIDKGRYELLTLLPDKDFIKAAVESLKGNNNYKVDSGPSFFRRMVSRISNWWNQPKESAYILLPDPLQLYKENISGIFNKYISWWKFSWFGHHHDARARAVNAQIQSSQDVNEIKRILQRQIVIMRQDNMEELPESSWLSVRWNEKEELKNIPKNMTTSGYCKVLTEALSVPSLYL